MTRSFKPGDFVIHRDRDVVGHVWRCKTDLAGVRYLSVYDRRSDEFDSPYTAPESTMPPERWQSIKDELTRLSTQKEQL